MVDGIRHEISGKGHWKMEFNTGPCTLKGEGDIVPTGYLETFNFVPAGESRYRKWEMQVHSTQNMVQVAGCGDPFPLFIPKFDIIRSGSLLEPKEPSVEADGVNIIGEFSTLGQKSAETWTVKLKHQ